MAGFVLYEGPSQLDGAPIVVVLTGTPEYSRKTGKRLATKASRNSKTGGMLQTWIMRSDIAPHHAVKSGADISVCGGCGHRPSIAKAAGLAECYVLVQNAPLSVWNAYHRGIYPTIASGALADVLAGLRVRIGSYGDPTAAPLAIWRDVVAAAEAVTGYTHQWRDARFAGYAAMLMASVDSAVEALEAATMGWRYFRVAAKGDAAKLDREASCPASKEAGARTTCSACIACGGLSSRAKVSMVIQAH